eukprot:gene8528-10483_t
MVNVEEKEFLEMVVSCLRKSGMDLKADQIKHAGFLELGMDSIMILQLIDSVNEKYNGCYRGNNSKIILPPNYIPPIHTDSAPLPHKLTLEFYSQEELVEYLRGGCTLESMKNAFKYFKDRLCLGIRERVDKSDENPSGLSDHYKWFTYKDIYTRSQLLSKGISHFIQPRELIGICGNNCLEWYISDFASLWNGLVVVPIHHTYNSNSMLEVILNSEISVIVVNRETIKLLRPILLDDKYNGLKLIIHMEDDYDVDLVDEIVKHCNLENSGNRWKLEFKTISDLYKLGALNGGKYVWKPVDDKEIVEVIYSSGTTGVPKGIPSTDRVWNQTITRDFLEYPSVKCSFASLAHSQRLSDWCYLFQGQRVGIYSGSTETLFEDLKILRPTHLSAVPRFWNKIYSQFINDRNLELEKLKTRDDGSDKEFSFSEVEEIDAKLYKRYHSLFGDRIRLLVNGGAQISNDVLTFLRNCWSLIRVSNSYGITETYGISSNGFLYQDVKIRLEAVPELDYFPSDEPYPRGELWVKTPFMAQSYYKNPELTKQSFDEDGYFKTGDIVELVGPRSIRFIDRKKHAFKLCNGEFVAPEVLEGLFLSSPLIDQIFIYGDILQTFLVAIVVPNKKYINDKDSNNNNNNNLRNLILQDINRISKEKNLPNYETPKSVSLELDINWKIENQFLTSSGKPKRPKLYEHYKENIDRMYIELNDYQKSIINSKDKRDILAKYIKSILNLDIPENTHDILSFDLSFSDIGGDSLSAVKLCSLLKEKENIDISPKLLLNRDITIDSIINGGVKIPKINWYNEMKLDADNIENNNNNYDDISDLVNNNLKEISSRNHLNIFITGSTGYLGSFILGTLLNQIELDSRLNTIDKVYVLLRGDFKSTTKARDHLKSILLKMEINLENPNLIYEKVEPLFGDLSKPNFGLVDTEFEMLSNSVDIIIHNGAIVNMALPYPNLKSTNVSSTKDIIKLSRNGKPKLLVYISTMGIFTNEFYTESTIPTLENMDYMSGYSQSKLVSDVLVRKAAKRYGIPTIICRPATIYCHSETGVDNKYDFYSLITKTIIERGLYPDTSQDNPQINLSPVDWVSNSIVKLLINQLYPSSSRCNGFDTFTNPKIYHLLNPDTISFDIYCKTIQSVIPTLKQVSYSDWKKAVIVPESSLFPIQHAFINNDKFPGSNNKKKIETERLVIRCYKPKEDVLKFIESIRVSLDHLSPWMPWTTTHQQQNDPNEDEFIKNKIELLTFFSEQFELGHDYTYAIFDKNELELIGSSGLHPRIEPKDEAMEIGYWINVNHVNKGIATEVVKVLNN